MNTYTISEISEMTDLSIPTLRYYEQIGLLDRVERAANGHRRYTDDDITRIHFLKRVRATGMSISEMQYYVDLYREGDVTLGERLHILEQHRASVEAQMAALADIRDFLDEKIGRYQQQMTTLHNQLETER